MLEFIREQELKEAVGSNDKVAALFMATWCPFCRAFRPVFEGNIKKLKGWVPVMVFLDDENNLLWDKYNIKAIPTVIYFKNEKILLRLDATAGAGLNEAELLNSFKQVR